MIYLPETDPEDTLAFINCFDPSDASSDKSFPCKGDELLYRLFSQEMDPLLEKDEFILSPVLFEESLATWS